MVGWGEQVKFYLYIKEGGGLEKVLGETSKFPTVG